MKERTVNHGTFVIEKEYKATPERVFAAFADPRKKSRWLAAAKNAEESGHEMDFREGGLERFRSILPEGPHKGKPLSNETIYIDIVQNTRIVMAYSMRIDANRISTSLATVELVARGAATTLIFTDQGAYFEGADGPKMREHGWQYLLGRLTEEI